MRAALGATPREIVMLVVKQGGRVRDDFRTRFVQNAACSRGARRRRAAPLGKALLDLRLANQPLVGPSRVFVIGLRLLQLVTLDESLLLRPALIHAFEAPFGAPSRRAHQLARNQDPDGIRVRRRQDPNASQLLRSIVASNVRSRSAPSATRRCFATGYPLTTRSTATSRVSPMRARSISQYGCSW